MNKSVSFYKIIGILLIIIAVIGYFTMADEFRHMGEFIGVSGILLSGIILLFVESKLVISKRLSLQWIAIFILLSIPFGGILLDNMLLGIGVGLLIGTLFTLIFGKRKTQNKHSLLKHRQL
jgi:hypothetical protein